MAQDPAIESEKSARALEIILMIAGAGLLGFLLFHLLLFRFGGDQAWCAVVADGLLQGEMPYRDRWCLRPPAIYLFYAAGQLLFGKSMMAIRVIEVGALLSLCIAFPYFSRRHLGSAAPGFAGAVLATLTLVQLEFWHTGQSESFGGIVLAWALLLATWRPGSRRWQLAAWFAAGMLMTFAAMLKPHMGGSFVLCVALLVWQRYRALAGSRAGLFGRRGILEPIVAFGASGAVTVAATLLPFVITGAFGDLVWTYRDVVPGYVGVSPRSQHLFSNLWTALRMLMYDFSPYLLPGLALWAFLPPLGQREREGALYLAAAIAPQVLGVALQAKFFPYHSAGMLPLLALWSVWGFFKIWRRVRRRPALAILLLVAALGFGMINPHWFWGRCGARWEALLNSDRRAEIEDQLYSHSWHYHGEILQTAQWLKSNTPPDARVFVWGPQGAIYFHSDRRPASRFIGNSGLRSRWAHPRMRKILEQELTAGALPAAIIVSHDDRPHWVTGHRRDSAESLARYPWLSALLETRYDEVERFGRLQAFLLRSDRR